MDGKEYYPQAANEDLESDSLATIYVSHCQSRSRPGVLACMFESHCVIFLWS